ncbi:hypothetical protein [Sphingobacterium sp. SYP-B4668]|uniref:hypothetical protein n=1 Tax=Sphingobacterium sp. SYP-B4668 TaxID=2996035 RepID=UPI0022DD3104|nr:hypothetical protein [Sphingobacterium sp. SYP-B4668]
MARKIILILLSVFICIGVFGQSSSDTIHYRKIYYFGGTGMAFPMGKTKDILSPKFSGSMGLDISLKDSRFYLLPVLYTLSFGYKQEIEDELTQYRISNGDATFYNLSLSAGMRKQYRQLNTYAYLGPGFGLFLEPRALVRPETSIVEIEKKSKFNISSKLGVGADYKFKGFFLGLELGYVRSFTKIQNTPIHALTVMVGLKSDITRLGDKVVSVLGVDGSVSGKD